MSNFYFSVDVETTGLNPIIHDVTAISVIETKTKEHVSFRVQEPVPSFWNWDESTREWAKENIPESVNDLPEKSARDIVTAIDLFVAKFAKGEGDFATFVAWPASFDYPFTQSLYFRGGRLTMPFHYRTIDVKSMMAGMYNVPIEARRGEINEIVGFELWTEPDEPHNPYNDALEQALVFERLLENKLEQ